MNQRIQDLMRQAGTDISGKWMSIDNAEKFAKLVIQEYNKDRKQFRKETKTKLGYSRIGLKNI